MSVSDVYHHGFDEESGKEISADTCPECSGSLQTEGGEISCEDCGLVVTEYHLDHGHKRYNFADDDTTPQRTGAPLTPARHDRGLSSEIGHGRDANGNDLSSRKRRQLGRLRREHNRARWQTKANRNLGHACTEIARMTSALDLPRSIREEASMVYRRAQNADLIVGRSIETIAAGSLYAACRCRGIARTAVEIAEVARCSTEKLELGFRVLNAELDLAVELVGPAEHIPRLASDCDVPDVVRRRARELADLATESEIANGRNPSGVAAGCLYFAAQEASVNVTQTELAEHADVSPVTIRARFQELQQEVA